jgi:hypothetical protein
MVPIDIGHKSEKYLNLMANVNSENLIKKLNRYRIRSYRIRRLRRLIKNRDRNRDRNGDILVLR